MPSIRGRASMTFWEAMRALTPATAMALRIARSDCSGVAWRNRLLVRFFCANPAPVETIADHYLAVCGRRDPHNLEGRTLRAHPASGTTTSPRSTHPMRRRTHRAHKRGQPTLRGLVPCSPIAVQGRQVNLRSTETAEDLVMESRAMRHCVRPTLPSASQAPHRAVQALHEGPHRTSADDKCAQGVRWKPAGVDLQRAGTLGTRRAGCRRRHVCLGVAVAQLKSRGRPWCRDWPVTPKLMCHRASRTRAAGLLPRNKPLATHNQVAE